MDRGFQQHSQIHPGNYSLLSVHEEYNFLNTMPESSSAMMSQNQTGCTISKIGFQQNRPMYTASSPYLPPSHHSNKYMWTQLENNNSMQHPNQPQNNIKMMSEQYVPPHSNVNMYSCDICKREFTTKHSLEQHRHTHSKEKQHYELNENSWDMLTFTDKQNPVKHGVISSSNVAIQHQLDSHTEKSKFVCQICSKSLCSKQSLTIHLRTHTGEKPFVCPVCEKRFTDNKNLTKHLRNHTGEKPYICDVCKETFSNKNRLNRHKVEAHIGEKPFLCNLCDKKFLSADTLKNHLKVVHGGEKPYVCEVCSKAFTRRFQMERHQVVHTGERRFHCEICNRSFKFKSGYDFHLKTHKIVEKDGVKTHVRIKDAKKEFACDLCSKAFTTRQTLIQHSRRHKGDTPFVCEVCNAGFVGKNFLNAHMKIHSKEHVCSVCNERFVTRSALNAHTKLHSKEHVCDLCGKSFPYKNLLNKHKLRHSNKTETVCPQCNLPFLTKVALEKHQRKIHQVKPFVCEICNKSFTAIESLRRHTLNPNIHQGMSSATLIPFQNNKEGITSDLTLKVKEIIESRKYLVQYKNGKKLFLCPVCNKKLNSKQRLVVHCRIHTDEKPFVCKVCGKGFHDKYILKKHLQKHSEKISSIESKIVTQSNIKKTLKCTLCAKSFMSVSSIISHRYTHILKKQCLTENILDGHKSPSEKFHNDPNILNISGRVSVESCIAKNKSLSCNICKKTFSSIFSLIKHKRLHILKKRFFCDICRELFISKSSLEKHLSHHKNKKSFACNVCPSIFHKQSLLNTHLQAHSDGKLFACKICDKTFSNESTLQKHDYLHIGRILYVCRECNKHVSSYKTYYVHVQNHSAELCQLLGSPYLPESKSVGVTSIMPQKHISSVKAVVTDKKLFVCAVCPKSFDDRNACIRHMELHTKTHVCWICNKKFDKERNLMNHMQSHVGKPFVCGMCPKSFSDQNSCVTHMKLHTEKKSHVSETCNDLVTETKSTAQDILAHSLKPLVSNACNKKYSDIKNIHEPELFCRKYTALNLSLKVNTEHSKVIQNQSE